MQFYICYIFDTTKNSVKHAKFTTSHFSEFEVPGIFIFHHMKYLCFESLHIQGIMLVFFAWRLPELLESYDGVKFGQLKAHLVSWKLKTKINSYVYFEMWSPEVW